VFASSRKQLAYYRKCSLRFKIEENIIIEAFNRYRFASVASTTRDTSLLSCLSDHSDTLLS
jgi:hypothetical protein